MILGRQVRASAKVPITVATTLLTYLLTQPNTSYHVIQL